VAAPGSPPAGLRGSAAASVVSALARTVLGALVLLVGVCVVPGVAGWQATVVTSGSMAPGVQPGDVTLVRPVEAAGLQPGQVLLVDDPDSPGGLLLHRLVAVTDAGLQLKGDANPAADGSLVAPSAVHGVGTVRLPGLGLPVLWASGQRRLPLTAAVLALAALVGSAVLHRAPDDEARLACRARRRRAPVRTTLRGTTAVLGIAVLLPATAAAAFTTTTADGANRFQSARYYSCALAASGSSASAYYAFQDVAGRTATNTGTAGSAANGTFAGGVSAVAAGPAKCGSTGTGAVSFDGSTGVMTTTYAVPDPRTFSLQLWFATTTSTGGKLIGFGDGANGAASAEHDRHVYLTNSGKLTFGIYDAAADSVQTTTTPGSYNDGAWHLMTATFSAGTGLRLYIDGALQASRTSVTAAEAITGYWRVGYDTIHVSWPGKPTSEHFQGSIAHVSIYNTRVLTAAEVADQYRAGN